MPTAFCTDPVADSNMGYSANFIRLFCEKAIKSTAGYMSRRLFS